MTGDNIHNVNVEQDKSIISAFEAGAPLGKGSPTKELSKISAPEGSPVDPSEIAYRLNFDAGSRTKLDLILGQFEITKYTLPQNAKKMDACLSYFNRFVDMARSKYDLVVLDVSPASSHLTLAAMNAATHVLAPVRPDKYSLRGLKAMHRLLDELFALQSPPEFMAIMNDVATDSPENVEREIRRDSEFGNKLLNTVIPHSRYFFARNAGAAQNPIEKLAINASGWRSADLKDRIRNAGDEILSKVSKNASQVTRNAGNAQEVRQEV